MLLKFLPVPEACSYDLQSLLTVDLILNVLKFLPIPVARSHDLQSLLTTDFNLYFSQIFTSACRESLLTADLIF
jgi:hypothetical protein